MKYFALLGVLLLAVACGGSDHHGFIDTSVAGGGGGAGRAGHAGAANAGSSNVGDAGESGAPDVGGSAGFGGNAGSGGSAGSAGSVQLPPILSITSPGSATDPDEGPVLVDHAHVVCNAKKANDPAATFAASSVLIEAFDSAGKSIQKFSGTQNVDDANEFFADFTLSASKAPNGVVSFKCTASDASTPPLSTSDTLSTLIDHGPTITVVSPALPQAEQLNYLALGVVPFKFNVLPAPLAADDSQAEVDQVTLTVNNVSIDLSDAKVNASPGTYEIDVNLADKTKFIPTPNGATSVSITATNKRKPLPADHPTPITATASYNFGIDGAGPVITITAPSVVNAPVLGRQVKLQFTIVDAQSKVDPSTVTVTLNSQEKHVFDPKDWSHSGDDYSFTIADTKNVPGANFQLSVSIEASDYAKNKALAATGQYPLDTSPPIVDLDPPPVVEVSAAKVCSAPFDPVGDASPNDGETIPSANIFRALVWDQANTTDGDHVVLHYSGVATNSVRLYAQADASQPLLVSEHATGVCDAIAIEGLHPPAPFQLFELGVAGTAFYGSKGEDVSTAVDGLCTAGTGTSPPDKLCSQKNSDMSRVIGHAIGVKESVIYTLPNAPGLECTGTVLDLSANLPNGWICIAARAVDNAGNVGISAPIRVCLNSSNGKTPDCANSSVAMPTCVDGCTTPEHFKGKDQSAPIFYVDAGN